MRIVCLILIATLASGLTTVSLAKPPPWAPAHGYRDKGKDRNEPRERYYVGYSGVEYGHDYDIERGRCDREKIGAVLGGVVGGVVGNEVGNRNNRVVATIIGAAAGALLGAKIGREMDDRDRACLGQALELGATGRRVVWVNESNGVRYELLPIDGPRGSGTVCRDFTLSVVDGSRRESRRSRACQVRPGEWALPAR